MLTTLFQLLLEPIRVLIQDPDITTGRDPAVPTNSDRRRSRREAYPVFSRSFLKWE
jgi:hypothetical protein